MSKNFVSKGQAELVHGIELAANYFQTSPSDVESAFNLSDKRQEALFYTIENMCLILDTLYPSDCEQLKAGFFKMIAFDAFVGAPDRHAMNWGVLIPAGGQAGWSHMHLCLIPHGVCSEKCLTSIYKSEWKEVENILSYRHMQIDLSQYLAQQKIKNITTSP